MEEKKTPGLTITEEPGGMIRKRLLDFDGTMLLDETVLPHDDLICFTDRQLKKYLQQLDEIAKHKYLLAFKRLRARFYEREYRCCATAPGKTVPGGYEDWIEEACEARDEYVEGKITGEELLRRINPEEEPLEADLEPEPFSIQKRLSLTPWDELVARDISFDPRRHFETMQFIDLGEENPQWRTITAKERELDAKQGKVSLREKYKK